MPQIFLSYRRDDTQALAGRIVDSLRSKLGRNSVYLDIDTAPPGVDFRDHVQSAICTCDALLLLIGERWIMDDGEKENRLFSSTDPVRLEIEAALAHDIPIIPLLAGKTEFPDKSDFPDALAMIAYRNAFRIDDGVDYHTHIDRLVRQIRQNFQHRAAIGKGRDQDAASFDGDASAIVSDEEASTADLQAADETPVGEAAAPARAAAIPNGGRIAVSIPQGLSIVGFLVALNSILAALGSMLWGEIHYWPAFMVYALACAYFGYWGILVAILSPIISSLLMIGGAPAYLYIPSNALQAALVIAAVRFARIDPGLATNADRLKFLGLGVITPSAVGGGLAWWLRARSGIGGGDPQLAVYTAWWTLENALPVVFPGVWLHGVVATVRRPFEWSKVSYLTSWVGRTFEYTAPWVVTLFVSLSISIFLVASRLGDTGPTTEAWSQIRVLAGESLVFRLLVLAGCVSVLIAVGFSVRHARQTWHLEQAIRRSMSSEEDANRILVGQSTPNARKIVTIIVFRLGNFRRASRRLRPAQLVDWLNSCYEPLDASAKKFSGKVDYFAPDGTVVIFDAQNEDRHAELALLCALECSKSIARLNAQFAGKDYPECVLGVGIHTGPVVASEIGPSDRRRYTVIGPTVDIARQMAMEAAATSQGPVTLSLTAMREAGIAPDSVDQAGLCEGGSLSLDGLESIDTYLIQDAPRLERRLNS